MLRILSPGLQSTLQGTPRTGFRHMGVPHAGPADAVSMAIANWLVDNEANATALEITYGGFKAEAVADMTIAISGAATEVRISGRNAPLHTTLQLNAGEAVEFPHHTTGMRSYLAIHGGFEAQSFLGSTSTYMPAGFGGLGGRCLMAGDMLNSRQNGVFEDTRSTPETYRPVFSNSFALRTCPSAEFDLLEADGRDQLFETEFIAGRQATRMGFSLEGAPLALASEGLMDSAPVYPGTIQCPESGVPIVLLCDAQTTGGYPRIAQIARCDRHLLGQIRPGDRVRLLRRSHDEAAKDYAAKQTYFQHVVPDLQL